MTEGNLSGKGETIHPSYPDRKESPDECIAERSEEGEEANIILGGDHDFVRKKNAERNAWTPRVADEGEINQKWGGNTEMKMIADVPREGKMSYIIGKPRPPD